MHCKYVLNEYQFQNVKNVEVFSLLLVCLLSFSSSEHRTVLSLLAAFCLVLIYLLVQRRCSWVSKVALALGLLGVYSYRAAVGNVSFPWHHSGQATSK